MAVFEIRSGPISHGYWMRKLKWELADEIMRQHKEIGFLHHQILKYARHTNECRWHGGHDCDCGVEDARAAAREWGEE